MKNAFQSTNRAPNYGNAFVSKLNATGSELVYSTYLGGSGNAQTKTGDSAGGIAVDEQGSAYVAGTASSADFPVKKAFQRRLKAPAATNAFLTKFDVDGDALVYSTYLGGSSGSCGSGCYLGDSGAAVAVDTRGNAYITGSASSPDFPTKGPFQAKLKDGAFSNAFVTKFDATGTALVYSTYLGGSYGDHGGGIAVDAAESAYVTGSTLSSDFPTRNAFQNQNNCAPSPGCYNGFVTKLDAAGTALVYSTYLGGNGRSPFGDGAIAVAVDAHGDAYVTGYTSSADFPIKNAFQTHNNATSSFGDNAFITKFDASGTALVYSSYLGGIPTPIGGDFGSGIAVDAYDNAYITGFTSSANFPTKDAFQDKLKGQGSAFVTKLRAK